MLTTRLKFIILKLIIMGMERGLLSQVMVLPMFMLTRQTMVTAILSTMSMVTIFIRDLHNLVTVMDLHMFMLIRQIMVTVILNIMNMVTTSIRDLLSPPMKAIKKYPTIQTTIMRSKCTTLIKPTMDRHCTSLSHYDNNNKT